MDSPQYLKWLSKLTKLGKRGFKPYYKWIVLNTSEDKEILIKKLKSGFKPYYKWIVLNTWTTCDIKGLDNKF